MVVADEGFTLLSMKLSSIESVSLSSSSSDESAPEETLKFYCTYKDTEDSMKSIREFVVK